MKIRIEMLLNPGTGETEPLYYYGPFKLEFSNKTRGVYIDFINYYQEFKNYNSVEIIGYTEDKEMCPDMEWVKENINNLISIMEVNIEPVDDHLITNYPYKISKFEFLDNGDNILLTATESMLANINKQYTKFNIKDILNKTFTDYVFIGRSGKHYFISDIINTIDITQEFIGIEFLDNDYEEYLKDKLCSYFKGIESIIKKSDIN